MPMSREPLRHNSRDKEAGKPGRISQPAPDSHQEVSGETWRLRRKVLEARGGGRLPEPEGKRIGGKEPRPGIENKEEPGQDEGNWLKTACNRLGKLFLAAPGWLLSAGCPPVGIAWKVVMALDPAQPVDELESELKGSFGGRALKAFVKGGVSVLADDVAGKVGAAAGPVLRPGVEAATGAVIETAVDGLVADGGDQSGLSEQRRAWLEKRAAEEPPYVVRAADESLDPDAGPDSTLPNRKPSRHW